MSEKLKFEIDLDGKRTLLEYLGIASRIINRLSDAEQYLLMALALSYELSYIAKVMQNIIRLAHVYQRQSEFAKAKVLFDQARSMINGNSMSATLAAAYHQHFGKYYFDQGLYGLTTCEFELALKIREENSSSADQLASSRLALTKSKNKWSIKLSDSIMIRRAISSDAEALHGAHMTSINQICVNDHSPDEIRVWGGRSFGPAIRVPAIKNQFYLVVVYKNKIEGFCQLKVEIKERIKSAHLFGFYITPEILNKKIGHGLINLVLDYGRSETVQIITLKSTITSFGFYKRYGFIQTGELTGPV